MKSTPSSRYRKRRRALRQLMFGRQTPRLGQALRFETLESRTLLAGDLESGLLIPGDATPDSMAPAPTSAWLAIEGEAAAEGEQGPTTVADFAQALTDNGIRFFGAHWCGHCIRQQNLFGDAKDLLPFIEVTVDEPANTGGTLVLNDVGLGNDLVLNPTGRPIDAFPTWEFPDGTRITGFMSLQELASASGIPLPLNVVSFETNLGALEVELLPGDAPNTVDNFLNYVNDGDYINSIIHRSATTEESGVNVIQGGGFITPQTTAQSVSQFSSVPTDAPIANEFNLSNTRLTVAMAKTSNPDSATSQFFVNVTDNVALDNPSNSGGFTVFGRVLDAGSAVPGIADQIHNLSTIDLLDATLSGQQQQPAVATNASGIADVVYDASTSKFDITLFVQGINQADLTAAHLHAGSFSDNGDVLVDLGDGTQWTPVQGGLELRLTDIMLPSQDVTVTNPNGGQPVTITPEVALLNGLTYVNVHTTAHPDGDIRGQLNCGTFCQLPVDTGDQLVIIQSATGSGLISGRVFDDASRDGNLDSGEAGLANVVVYSDANNNNSLDAGEISTTTAAEGTYGLVVTFGEHRIRQVVPDGLLQTAPGSNAGRIINVGIGREQADVNFGNTAIAAPSSVSLLNATNSGSTLDSITSFNNQTLAQALEFEVAGVEVGATVLIRADGLTIGQAVASADTIVVTTDGSTLLQDGSYSITAVQVFNSVAGPDSSAIPLVVDTTIAAFSSSPPDTIAFGQTLTYDPVHAEEGATSSYALGTSAPQQMTIDSTTGEIQWTPTASDIGSYAFDISLTDAAGNSVSQAVNLTVTGTGDFTYRYEFTNVDSQVVTQVNSGEDFFLNVYVSDTRGHTEPGIESAHLDVAYDAGLASPTGPIEYGTSFPNNQSGDTATSGLLDEVGGSVSTSTASNEVLLFRQAFTANHPGELTFVGNAPESHENVPSDPGQPLLADEVNFAHAVLAINSSVNADDDQFGPEEDSAELSYDVLANDDLLPGSTGELTIKMVGVPSQGGEIQISSDAKTLLYRPQPNFAGTETVTYVATDAAGNTDEATVTFSVNPVNDPPQAVDDTGAFPENAAPQILDVLANDIVAPDPESEQLQLRITNVTAPVSGANIDILSAGRLLEYTPVPNYSGIDTFTYTMEDEGGLESTATVTLTVGEVSFVPVANDDSQDVDRDTQDNVIDVLVNDVAARPNDTLSIVSAAVPTSGTVTIDNDRLLYTPNPGFVGSDTFTYMMMDNHGEKATATVNVNVNAVNTPPTAVDDPALSAASGVATTLDLLSNDDTQPDAGETLSIIRVENLSQGGDVVIASDGQQVTYTSAQGFEGTETFTYTISDGNGGEASATATVAVTQFVSGSLGGSVFTDSNGDGAAGLEEAGIGGVEVVLTGTDINGNPVQRSTTTDSSGEYRFLDLVPGVYRVRQTQPLLMIDGADTTPAEELISTENDDFTVEVDNGSNATSLMFAERGRMAATVSPLDFLGSLPDSRVVLTYSHLDDAHWYRVIGPGWEDVRQLDADIDDAQGEVTVTATDAAGNVQTSTVSFSDVTKVQRLFHNGDASVIRLLGTHDAFFGVDSTASSNSSEGEAVSVATPLALEGEAFAVSQPSAPLLALPAGPSEATLRLEGESSAVPETERIDEVFAHADPLMPAVSTPHVESSATGSTGNGDFSAAVDMLLTEGESLLST